MSRSESCPKCGASNVMAGARFVDGHEQQVRVEIHSKPDAKVFKGAVRVPMEARVCGGCGFIELYASDPARLREAHKRNQ